MTEETPLAEAPATKDAPATKEPVAVKEPAATAPAAVPSGRKTPPGGAIWGTGRRKSSVARVRVKAGGGQILVNSKPFDEHFCIIQDRKKVEEALLVVGAREKIDVHIQVAGGGATGQAGAIAMGLARALRKYDAAFDEKLRVSGLLTRDSRMKERKKYGRRGARRGFQFSKR